MYVCVCVCMCGCGCVRVWCAPVCVGVCMCRCACVCVCVCVCMCRCVCVCVGGPPASFMVGTASSVVSSSFAWCVHRVSPSLVVAMMVDPALHRGRAISLKPAGVNLTLATLALVVSWFHRLTNTCNLRLSPPQLQPNSCKNHFASYIVYYNIIFVALKPAGVISHRPSRPWRIFSTAISTTAPQQPQLPQ